MIRTRGIQLPKLALYQAELRPDARKLAETLEKASLGATAEQGRNRPNAADRSRNLPEVNERPPLLTRERLAELTAIVERRIAERAVAPATLGVLARARALLANLDAGR